MAMGDPRRPASKLVIFDCDGVLVDSEPISNTVLAQALTAAGLPTSPEQALTEYRGRIMSDVVSRAEAALGAALPADFVPAFEAARVAAFQRDLAPVPGAADAVRSVREAGVAVCVASQGKLEKTEMTLALTGLRELFDAEALFSAYSVPRGKPHPDLFLYAAEQMGVAPAQTLVVEDTTLGVRAAVAAGMRVLGFAPPGTTGPEREALAAAGAEPIGNLAEVVRRLGTPADSPPIAGAPAARRAIAGELHPTAVRFAGRLAERGVAVHVRMAPATTRTAVEAAAALGCEVGQIVKSLVFLRDREPVMVLCAGDRRVDARRLGLEPATPEQARAATGFAIGGIPPLGHDRELLTTIDASLRRFDTVWAAAGTPQAVFEITVDELIAALPEARLEAVTQ